MDWVGIFIVIGIIVAVVVIGFFLWVALTIYGTTPFSPPPSAWMIVLWPFELIGALFLAPIDAYRKHRAKVRNQ